MKRKEQTTKDPITTPIPNNADIPTKTKQSSKRKKKKAFWMTRTIAEEFGREYVLLTTFKETVIYIIFVIFITLATIGKHTITKFYLTQVINDQLIEREFDTINDYTITFNDIRTVADFWHYTETLMIDSLYNDKYGNGGETNEKILNENLLLGVPRIRQVKVRNDSCIIHEYFRRLFLNCYHYFNDNAEDRRSFGLKTAPIWVYNSVGKTGSLSFKGTVATYNGGGYYVDLARTKQESLTILKNLKDNLWITRGTRAIFIDFTIYNVNLNLFSICKLIFEFPPTGGVLPSTSFNTLKLIRLSIWDNFVLICEWIVYIFLLFYLIQEIREFIYFKWRYFTKFFTYINLSILTLGIICLIYRTIILQDIERFLENLQQTKYLNLEYLCWTYVTFNTMLAILLFLVYIKIFKYLNFNKTMGQLNNTLTRCAFDILGFSIMFFIVFIAYAELGYLLFGTKVDEFSSFGISMFTLLRTILGDFDYDAIENANRYLAPVYFLSYIFLVFFVLLNMFLAIINDTYTDVKTEITIAPNELQMFDLIKQKFYDFFRKFTGRGKFTTTTPPNENATILQEIRDILKKYGFNDVEIEMFFARYNIDPNINLNHHDINQLIDEIDGKTQQTNRNEEYVQFDDFIRQQQRLDNIEQLIDELCKKIEQLLKQLDKLENIHVNKRKKQ